MFSKQTLTIALLSVMSMAVRLDTDACYSDDMFLGMACSTRAGTSSRSADYIEAARSRVSSARSSTASVDSDRAREAECRERDYWVERPESTIRVPVFVGARVQEEEEEEE